MIANDVIILICALFVVVKSISIYMLVRGSGWLLMVLSWCYMLILRVLWLYATITEDMALKGTIGSSTTPHWIIIPIALVLFDRDIKRILRGVK